MTRATLLHVLDCPTALGPAEVRELEQLAQAFPYCQTAHLLLAKAAHDQGTMLAGQRLRRAATYAADRALLRRLIEQVAPAILPAPAPDAPVSAAVSAAVLEPLVAAPPLAELTVPPTAAPVTESVQAVAPGSVSTARPVPDGAESGAAPALAIPEIVPVAFVAATEAAGTSVCSPEAPATIASAEPAAAETEEVPPALATAAHRPEVAQLIALAAPETATTDSILVAENEWRPAGAESTQTPVLETSPPLSGETSEDLPNLAARQEAAVDDLAPPQAEASLPLEAPAPAAATDELPAQAPAVRPPVEVGEARFEFGLADASPPAAPTYELPGLIDEWAASAVTRGLGRPDALASASAPLAEPVFTPAAFTGDATVGYAFGESSRLGLSMQLLDLLMVGAASAANGTAVVAVAQPPAVALPPIGMFFEPDPLLLDHWATHCPPPPALPSSLDLINNFLRRQPRLTRPAMLPPAATHQADLSVRSTRAEPDLVSENLARIFIRQGKTARAIEIYEKLMVKQPEKMAYFAAQIQSLQPSA